MKVAALNPQFIIEPHVGVEKSEQARAQRELHLKSVTPQSADPSSPGEELESETREGLRRLSKLLRRHEQNNNRPRFKEGDSPSDRRKRRALELYRDLSVARDPTKGKGENFDDFF